MALFGRKKEEPTKTATPQTEAANGKSASAAAADAASDGAGGGDQQAAFNPEKATKFFGHAKVVGEAGNYEYSMQSWLSGMRLNPGSVEGVEGFFFTIAQFLNEHNGKKSVSKEVSRVVSGKSDLDRYLNALLEWGQKPKEAHLAVRAFELCSKIGLVEPGKWIGDRAFLMTVKAIKPRKDLIVRVSESYERLKIFDRAVQAAEAASRLDPSDGHLAAKMRSLAAQATMNRGGYDKQGEEGGYRQNLKDAAKQRQLDQQDRITKTESTVEAILGYAEEEYRKRPNDMPTVEKYAKALVDRGRPEDEERAHEILMKTHAETKQFRFREWAGDIRIRQADRRARQAKLAMDANPSDPELPVAYQAALNELGELQVQEYKLRVEAYPTDLTRKFRLGERYFHTNRFAEAIEMFQESQAEPKLRAPSLSFLGKSFLATDWIPEAIETFRAALEVRDIADDVKLELQYNLMLALKKKGATEKDLQAAEEADKLASSIAMKQITYRDIRAQREELRKLVASLRGGG